MVYKSAHHAQPSRFRLGLELHPRLFQHPCLDALVMHAQQVQRIPLPTSLLEAHALHAGGHALKPYP